MLIDKLFRDKNGNIVLFQPPNLPIAGWFVSLTASLLFSGFLRTGLINLSGAFLFLWSYLEITDGTTNFRRFVGVIVLSILIAGYFI